MKKPKFIKEIEKSEWKERAKCWRWYIWVYWELDHKPMVELESLEIIVKELHKLEEENKKLKSDLDKYKKYYDWDKEELMESCYWLARENDEQTLEIEDLKREVEKLKETIKDHQLYEEKLEHRIIEFEELLHWE